MSFVHGVSEARVLRLGAYADGEQRFYLVPAARHFRLFPLNDLWSPSI